MDTQYKVSIGIPIYGVEKYIERCVRSLLEQTYKNIEYIFIDDCGKDDSIKILFQILNEYPQKKSQVRVIRHDSNKGLAEARNTFIKNATGEFVMHVDSDDFIDVTLTEKVVISQMQTNADIVTAGACGYHDGQLFSLTNALNTIPHSYLVEILKGHELPRIWGRLIRRSLYDDYGIHCERGVNMGEDKYVISQLLYYASKITFFKENLYFYTMSACGSYTSIFKPDVAFQSLRTRRLLESFFMNKEEVFLEALNSTKALAAACYINDCARFNEFGDFYREARMFAKELTLVQCKEIPFYRRIVLHIKNKPLLRIYVQSCDRLLKLKKKLYDQK